MKKFIRNTAYMILIACFLALGFYFLNAYLFDRYGVRLKPEETSVVCGASITRNAINDGLIPGLRNLSIAGRSYMDFFLSIKRITRDNPQVETVITDFTLQSLPGSRDYFFYLPKLAPRSFEKIYPLLDNDHLNDYPVNYKAYIKSLFRYQLTPNVQYIKNALHDVFPETFDYEIPYEGIYTDRIENDLDSIQLEIGLKKYFYHKGELLPFSSIDLNYLDSIVDFTRANELNLVLFSGPLHTNALKRAEESYLNQYSSLLNGYLENEHIKVLSFIDYPLPDSCFANHNHLNYHGAKIISQNVRDSLELWYGN